MGISDAYVEMVEARVDNLKARLAVAKADAKVAKAKKEIAGKYRKVFDDVQETIETPLAAVKVARERGNDILDDIKAGAKVVQDEMKSTLNRIAQQVR